MPCLGLLFTDVLYTLSSHTYGITSDPLTQFACAFSALIHDVGEWHLFCLVLELALKTNQQLVLPDHVGVSNAQLVKEGVPIAAKYKERSVAEQVGSSRQLDPWKAQCE